MFAIGLIGMFTIGGISGVMHASPPADLQQTDTYFVVAHFHYVLFGGSLMGLFAGIYYYFPKLTGRCMNEALGQVALLVDLRRMNLTFFPMHFSGMLGMPRRIYTYDAGQGWDTFNMLSSIGAFIMGSCDAVLRRKLPQEPEARERWRATTRGARGRSSGRFRRRRRTTTSPRSRCDVALPAVGPEAPHSQRTSRIPVRATRPRCRCRIGTRRWERSRTGRCATRRSQRSASTCGYRRPTSSASRFRSPPLSHSSSRARHRDHVLRA